MKKIFIAIILVSFFAAALCGYEQQSASDKQSYLLSQINGDSGTPGAWPSAFQLLKIFTESLWVTGQYVSDFFPAGRQKVIHSVGAIAKVHFNWNSAASQYTGLFKQADYGFIRASTAKAPGWSGIFTKTKSMTPGISLKFLRDNIPSANFMAMWQLDGQKDFNFFLNPFCNHVANRPDLPFDIKLLGAKFSTVSAFPGLVGLSDFAKYTQSGAEESTPNFPFALVFQPNPALTAQFLNTNDYDIPTLFPASFGGNEVLYKVYAVDQPGAITPVLIGTLQLDSKFIASSFADEGMFFKHQFIEEDFALRPQWLNTFNQAAAKVEGAALYAPQLPAF